MNERFFYLDTSALIKRYVEEVGSQEVENIWPANCHSLSSAALTYAEIYATFYRLNREGRISGKQLSILCREFEEDWKTFAIIDFSSEVRKEVPNIISRCSLRGADLLHLASAISLKGQGLPIELITFDSRMIQACEDLDLKCLP